MNFKKLSILVLSLFVLSAFLCNTSLAQTSQGTTVATISISNAKIVSQADRDFVLSFDISNKTGAQPDIKYGVQLFQTTTSGSVKVDEQVYDEVLSLGSNTTINKSINYTVPSSVSAGTYKIYILSKNSSGLPLGIALAGQATIGKSTVSTIKIDNSSCYIVTSTSADATKYPIDLGFSIKPKDQLILKCKVTSTLANKTFKTNFVTRSGSAYGSIVSVDASSTENILIKNGTNDVTIILPIASKPQSYNLLVSLESEKVISNTLSINYNLMGQTGVIQNVVFDKTYYGKGDKANVQIYSTQYGTGTISIIVTDENNEICSATTTQNVSSFSVINLPIKITKDCNNPKANVILSVGDKVLDSKDFNITSNEVDRIAVFKKDMITKIIVIVIAIIAVLLIGLFVKRSKKPAIMMLFMLVIAGFGFSVSAEECITGNPSTEIAVGGKEHWAREWIVYDLGASYPIQDIRCNDGDTDNDCASNLLKLEGSNDLNGTWTNILNYGDLPANPNSPNQNIKGINLNKNYYFVQNDKHSGEDNMFYDFGARRTKDWSYNSNYVTSYRYYRLSTYQAGGDAIVFKTFDTRVTIPGCALKIDSFTSSSNSVQSGGSITLSWTTTGATYCHLNWSNGIEGGTEKVDPNSSYTISNMTTGNVTQVLYCTKVENETINTVSQFDYVSQFGFTGTDDGQFNYPTSLAINSLGNIFVADMSNNRIQKFTPDGIFMTKFGSYGYNIKGKFFKPYRMTIDSLDNIYVLDPQPSFPVGFNTKYSRIQKFNSSEQYDSQFGSRGSNYGQFISPSSIHVDSSGNIYVSDSGNNRIGIFSSSGTYSEFGLPGTDNGQFNNPSSVTTDSSGNIYVADSGNNRIQKFTSTGRYISQLVSSRGSGEGQFGGDISDIYIDPSGNIYIVDKNNNRIQKFDKDYAYKGKFGSYGTSNGLFNQPDGIVFDSFGNIYVSDANNNRVQKFAGSDITITTQKTTDNKDNPSILDIEVDEPEPIDVKISANPSSISNRGNSTVTWSASSTGMMSCTLNREGNQISYKECSTSVSKDEYQYVSQIGENFNSVTNIIFDSSGNMYAVTDMYRGTVQKFDSSGIYISQFDNPSSSGGAYGVAIDSKNNIFITDAGGSVKKFKPDGSFDSRFGSYGTGDGQFNAPWGIVIDSNDNIYVADHYNYRIQKFDSTGKFIKKFGSKGTGDGQFMYSGYLFIHNDNIYVADGSNNRIQKFNLDGVYLSQFGSYGTGDGQFNQPMALAFDSLGNIYVADAGNNRIQKFDPNGNFLSKFNSYGIEDNHTSTPWGIAIDSNDNIYVPYHGKTVGSGKILKFSKILPITSCNLSGSSVVENISTTTEVSIYCTNKNNSATASTTINVEKKLCNKTNYGVCVDVGTEGWIGLWTELDSCVEGICSINYNSSTILNWGTEGEIDSCSLFKDNSNSPFVDSTATSGSVTSGKITKDTKFRLECQYKNETIETKVSLIPGEEEKEKPGEQDQNELGVSTKLQIQQSGRTEQDKLDNIFYLNRKVNWSVEETENRTGATRTSRVWSGDIKGGKETSDGGYEIVYTTVGKKTVTVTDTYQKAGFQDVKVTHKIEIKVKLDPGTNTEI